MVLFNPNDIQILKDGPAARRRFLDIMISQLRKGYVYNYNQYIKILEQRNNYLRQIKFERRNQDFLEILDKQLAIFGKKIYDYRQEFIEKIKEKINVIHGQITDNKETIKIEYQSNCRNEEEYLEKLKKSREIDIKKGYTVYGIHKDDFNIFLNNILINIYGSQGQKRTSIISLKIAELELIHDEIGEYPILLLDDFMSELDNLRIQNFIKKIKHSQVIITCTDKINLENQFGKVSKVQQGKII